MGLSPPSGKDNISAALQAAATLVSIPAHRPDRRSRSERERGWRFSVAEQLLGRGRLLLASR